MVLSAETHASSPELYKKVEISVEVLYAFRVGFRAQRSSAGTVTGAVAPIGATFVEAMC